MSLSFLAKEDAAALLPFFKKIRLHAGSVMIDNTRTPSHLWIVASGRLLVKKHTQYPGRFVTIALLDKGAIVGEQMIAGCLEHSTTVTALDDVDLLELSLEKWEIFTSSNPAGAVRFLQYALKISSLRLQGATERLAELL